jgi:hypothetical protein
MICDMFLCGQKMYQEDKFISACVLSMGTMLCPIELCTTGLKCLKMAVRVWLMQSAQVVQPQPHRMKKELGN